MDSIQQWPAKSSAGPPSPKHSRNSLPGDNLYPVKRVAESAGLALTFDETAKAQRHLDIAATRLDEVEQLAERDPQAPVAPGLYSSAFQEFDTAANEGSSILLTSDTTDDAAALDDLRSWAAQQTDRLNKVQPALPGQAASDARSALTLLKRLVGQTDALTSRSSCSELPSGLGSLSGDEACTSRSTDDPITRQSSSKSGGNGHGPTGHNSGSTTSSESADPRRAL